MSATFWFIAGVLTGVMATAISMPLWHGIGGAISPPPSHQQGETAAQPAGADTGARSQPAPSMEEATARLQARLERDGGSADDWELLAKSYEFLGRTAEAARARARAGTATAKAATGPVNAAAQNASMAGALVAYERLTATTGPQVATTEISGTVSIESRLASRVARDATLFIYAKAADSPGPPLAVLRLTARDWPVSFRLDDSLAMIPSRRLSQFQRVVVEARISRSGQAAPAPGDLYVTSDIIDPSSGKKLALVISHEIG